MIKSKRQYYSDIAQLFRKEGRQLLCNGTFSRTNLGICCVYSVFGFPVCGILFKPNFKTKIYFLGLPLFTWKRTPISLKEQIQYPLDKNRKHRIYIHIGGLPFFDNRSGIPRVAKKFCEEGLKSTEFEVLPVYPDPKDGTYRIALEWIREKGYDSPWLTEKFIDMPKIDPKMTIRQGDWFIHTMINPNELEYEKAPLEYFRRQGVKIGFLLHDIIAERHPDYFRKRDARAFARWLRMIGHYDGIFAISQATLNDYQSWLKEQGLPKPPCPLEWFHLGADFKRNAEQLNELEHELLSTIKHEDYYLQVSTLEPRKGYKQLLDTFDLLWKEGKESSLVIVGRKGWLVNDLCRRIKRHPQLNKKLFWFSNVSDEFLAQLYIHAKCVIVASENEGFGLSVVEGAFYDKPLLLRDIPVFRELVGDDAYYFDGLSGEVLAKTIKNLDATLLSQSSIQKRRTLDVRSWESSFLSFSDLLKS